MQNDDPKCPYRSLCQCPGDSPGEEPWEPIQGFIKVEEGIKCVDWDIVVKVPPPEVPSNDSPDVADKIDNNRYKYNRSAKRRLNQEKYEASKKGIEARERHVKSEAFKLSQQKFYFSEKGRLVNKRRNARGRLFRAAKRWLTENPGKTFEDFLKTQKGDKTESGNQ